MIDDPTTKLARRQCGQQQLTGLVWTPVDNEDRLQASVDLIGDVLDRSDKRGDRAGIAIDWDDERIRAEDSCADLQAGLDHGFDLVILQVWMDRQG